MNKGEFLSSLFPKRWIPGHEPQSAWEQETLDDVGELLLPTRVAKVGTYEPGEKYPETCYTFKDQRHLQIIEIHYRQGEILMVVYAFGAIGKPIVLEGFGEGVAA